MAKLIHSMIRVLDPERSVTFYEKALHIKVKERCDFDDFSLIYMGNDESGFELELTYNAGEDVAYTHGTGYGHLAVSIDDIKLVHAELHALGMTPGEIKHFFHQGKLLASFFFLRDPDGYQIEFIQRSGRYQ